MLKLTKRVKKRDRKSRSFGYLFVWVYDLYLVDLLCLKLRNYISGPRHRFGSGSLHYGGSLPRRLLRQNTTSTVASNSASNQPCGFKYAEAHEIATATLRQGCLQPTVGNFLLVIQIFKNTMITWYSEVLNLHYIVNLGKKELKIFTKSWNFTI